MRKLISKFYPQIIIFGLVAILFAVNYKAGTFLSGWDNLHPEFNFILNIKRSIFSVWQEYQGLGLIGGLAYAADLPRQLFLWILSFVLPVSILRYIYTFLMLLVGSWGMYKLLDALVFSSVADSRRIKVSLAGALFYILNFGTIQVFFNSFESFTAHFAFLPWLVYIFFESIRKTTKRNILLFILLNILAIPQGYVPTIFLVYILSLCLATYGSLIARRSKEVFKKSIGLVLLIIVINSFWFLPFLYYTFTHAQITVVSHMNQMSTEDIYLRNKQFGDLNDVALLRGFSFDYIDPNINGIYTYLMQPWRNYMANPFILAIGYLSFAIVVIGIISGVVKKRDWVGPFFLVFLFSFIMLGSNIFLFSWIDEFLRQHLPLFGQVFRVTFTKFGILTIFSYSVFFAYGFLYILEFASKNFKAFVNLDKYIFLVVGLLLFIYIFPAFKGDLFYDKTRVNIPKDYFNLMNFLNATDSSGRIALLPQYTYWGWDFYKWGYGGSGFLWYGLNFPTMDRAFDGYGDRNENYYWEISNAIYSSNGRLFESVLNKYQTNWILLDLSLFQPSAPRSIYTDRLLEILNSSNKIKLVNTFGSLNLYKYDIVNSSNNYVSLLQDGLKIGPQYISNNFDKGYQEYGNYISVTSDQKAADVYYPFRSLFTGRQQSELEFNVVDRGDYFSFSAQIPKSLEGGKLILPPINSEEITQIDNKDLSKSVIIYPQVYLDGQLISDLSDPKEEVGLDNIGKGNLEIKIPKIWGYYSGQLSDLGFQPARSCDQFNKGVFRHDLINVDGEEMLRLTSLGSSNCLDFDLPNLTQRIGYLVTVKSRNIEGKSLLFAVINKNSDRSDIETYLPKKNDSGVKTSTSGINKSYFVIPPMEYYGVGYTLHIDNVSIGQDKTINDIGLMSVNPIPYDFLTSIKIIDKTQTVFSKPSAASTDGFTVDHQNPSFYQIEFNNEAVSQCANGKCGNLTLVLSQSYDSGWKAYEITNDWLTDSWYMKLLIPLFGREIKSHVMVNSWENGWSISNQLPVVSDQLKPKTVVIVYLPQYLEYLGFGILGVLGLYLVLSINKSRKIKIPKTSQPDV